MKQLRRFGSAALLTFAVVAHPFDGFAQEVSTDEIALRVVTYNIAAGRNAGMDEIAAVLDSLHPDIIGLQEVASNWEDVSAGMNQAEELGRRLGKEAFYAPIYTSEDNAGKERGFGLAVLSTYPMLRRENHLITRLSTQEKDPVARPMPGFPEVTVSLNGAQVTVFNTHLDFRKDARVRRQQVDDMLSIIGEMDEPVVLLGDMNARADAPEIQPLFRGFVDAWNRKGAPGFTGPVGNPDRRIDYVLFSRDCAVENVFVHNAETSDHFPVVADLICTF